MSAVSRRHAPEGRLKDSRRFATLDALRGIAAILVMVFHAGKRSPFEVTGGYLAVDLFFGLSGFVIALAYDQRLREGLGLARFTCNRLIRIYPMYLAGLLLGSVLYGWSLSPFVLLPDPTSTKLLPANVPMWSLLTELIVNVAFALLAIRTGRRGLIGILVLSGGALAWGIVWKGDANAGAFWKDAGIGLLRTVFSFALGVALYRLHRHFKPARRETWLAGLLLPALAALLIFAPLDRTGWDMLCIFVLMPVLLWLGTLWELPRHRLGQQLGQVLGDISFPLYCLHGPIILIMLRRGSESELWLSFACLLAAAWAMDRWVDRPLRARLAALRWTRARPSLA